MSGCLGETTGDVPPRHPGPQLLTVPAGVSVSSDGWQEGWALSRGCRKVGEWGARRQARVLAGPPLCCLLQSPGLRPERAPASCAALEGPGRPASVLPTWLAVPAVC